MAHVTVLQVGDWTKQDYSIEQTARVNFWIDVAERYAVRMAGWDFFDPNATDADQSKDWVEVVCRIVARLLATDDPQTQKVLAGPMQSERLNDYQYTVRSTIREEDLRTDPMIAELLSFWSDLGAPAPGVVVAGPTRERKEQLGDVELTYDISRDFWPLSWKVTE